MTDWAFSLVGGALIGLSASIARSRARAIAGVSGILGGFLREPSVRGFRPGFLGAELLTGFGTQLGRGCTSGHGVCGISRLSLRSLAATAMFMLSAALVGFVTHHAWAGTRP